MSYKLKGQKIIIEGEEQIITPSSLPVAPEDGHYAIDSSDGKLKVYNETKSRWIILGDAEDVVFDNSSNGFISDNTQDAIEEVKANSTSSIIQATFQNNGTSSNIWLNHGESPIPSNNTPFIIPFDCKFVGISFSNDSSGVDLDVEVNISNFNNGSTIDKTFIYELRDVRDYIKTDINTNNANLILNAGDKAAVYLRDQGSNPNDPVVYLYFKTLNEEDHELSENHSSSITVSLGPITIILG